MKDSKSRISKVYVQRGVLLFEALGFMLAIVTCWITEYLDPPFILKQVKIETLSILILGICVVYLTWRLIRRIKYLEGFLLICASCKQVRIDERWVHIEQIISNQSDLQLSHGVCPKCAEKLYGKVFKGKING